MSKKRQRRNSREFKSKQNKRRHYAMTAETDKYKSNNKLSNPYATKEA